MPEPRFVIRWPDGASVEEMCASLDRYCWESADFAQGWWMNLQAFADDIELRLAAEVYGFEWPSRATPPCAK